MSFITKTDINSLIKYGVLDRDINEFDERKLICKWRVWCLKNHPDKGGNTSTFQNVLSIFNRVKTNIGNGYKFTPNVTCNVYSFGTSGTKRCFTTDNQKQWYEMKKEFKEWTKANNSYKPTKQKRKEKHDATMPEKDKYYNKATKRYIIKDGRTYKKYERDGYVFDHVEKTISNKN
jgi:hypothetical protein